LYPLIVHHAEQARSVVRRKQGNGSITGAVGASTAATWFGEKIIIINGWRQRFAESSADAMAISITTLSATMRTIKAT
jgi:hypothetical protein